MNLKISGHHVEVTPALRQYTLDKLDRVTRHFDGVVDVNVLLSVEKLKEKERRQSVQVTLKAKDCEIFVEESNEDMYAAIDVLMKKLDRKVTAFNRRAKDRHPGRCLKRAGGHCHDDTLVTWPLGGTAPIMQQAAAA